MKVTLAYQQPEAPAAARLIAWIRSEYPGVKVRKSERHPPFIHMYLTVDIPQKSSIHAGLR